jgi:hypothetical protein
MSLFRMYTEKNPVTANLKGGHNEESHLPEFI